MRDLYRRPCRSGVGEAEGSLIREVPGTVGAALTRERIETDRCVVGRIEHHDVVCALRRHTRQQVVDQVTLRIDDDQAALRGHVLES